MEPSTDGTLIRTPTSVDHSPLVDARVTKTTSKQRAPATTNARHQGNSKVGRLIIELMVSEQL